MRLGPRRKRTWVLVLLGVVIFGVASIWLAASAKSDFEKAYDGIKVGTPFVEVFALAPIAAGSFESTSFSEGQDRHMRCFVTSDDGEQIELVFVNDQLTEKEFTPLTGFDPLRRLWAHCFRSNPPF
jgi:hypothetical protein